MWGFCPKILQNVFEWPRIIEEIGLKGEGVIVFDESFVRSYFCPPIFFNLIWIVGVSGIWGGRP